MKNPTNSTAVLTVNLLENATGVEPPSEWTSHLSNQQNAERIDRQLNSPYYKKTDFVRHNKKYKPVLKTCSRLARIFFDELIDHMGQDNMLAISYNDIEQAFQISRPSIFPCIIELAERGLIIYMPGNSSKSPSTFYINPKLAGLAKLSHQKHMETEFEKTLRQQPGLIINKKKSIPDGETCFNRFYDICKELGINDEDEETELGIGNGFTVIPIADKKNKFFVNQIQSKQTAAPNPKRTKKGDAASTATKQTRQAAQSPKKSITRKQSKKQYSKTDFENDPEIPFNDVNMQNSTETEQLAGQMSALP